jgi:hypothetical protein
LDSTAIFLSAWFKPRQAFLAVFQRGNFHHGAFGVGAMHGLAIVLQSLLRDAFWHSCRSLRVPPKPVAGMMIEDRLNTIHFLQEGK